MQSEFENLEKNSRFWDNHMENGLEEFLRLKNSLCSENTVELPSLELVDFHHDQFSLRKRALEGNCHCRLGDSETVPAHTCNAAKELKATGKAL